MIVLISGPPGAGKTTLARHLAPALQLPLVAKDDIKEALYDSLGSSDREWSQKLGAATWDVLFKILERAVEAGASIMIESNFHTEHRERIAALAADVIEVYCFARPETLESRIRERDRHPGHADAQLHFDGRAMLVRHQPVVDRVVRVDTEDPSQVDVDSIIEAIREADT